MKSIMHPFNLMRLFKPSLLLLVCMLACVIATLLAAACGGNKKEKVFVAEPAYSTEMIDSIIHADTTHMKVFLFTSTCCYGCINYYKEYLKDAMDSMDTSKWKLYCILCDTIENDEDMQKEIKHFVGKGFPASSLIFLNRDYPTMEQMQEFTDLFKRVPDTSIVIYNHKPQCFCVDRHGYVLIQKEYDSPKKEHYQYVPVEFNKRTLTEDEDYSKEYADYSCIVSHTVGHHPTVVEDTVE